MPDMIRPDFSEYVAHFTKTGPLRQANPEIDSLDARQRLSKILGDRQIKATKMPWFGARCVAFTECTWTSLLAHAETYSPYGIGFHKHFLWEQGGGPAIYLRPNLYDDQADYVERLAGRTRLPFSEEVKNFLTPISREPFRLRSGDEIETFIDFSHEREWRVPRDLTFEYGVVQFVIVKDFDDLVTLPGDAVTAIGKDRFLCIANYKRVEEMWPVLHIQR